MCFPLTRPTHSRRINRLTPRQLQLLEPLASYEIRIVRSDGQMLVIPVSLMGDHAARRRAETLAMPGDYVEVWRDMACIYEAGSIATVQ